MKVHPYQYQDQPKDQKVSKKPKLKKLGERNEKYRNSKNDSKHERRTKLVPTIIN
jgi:hypothetical protein